jgi:hypothetical protein
MKKAIDMADLSVVNARRLKEEAEDRLRCENEEKTLAKREAVRLVLFAFEERALAAAGRGERKCCVCEVPAEDYRGDVTWESLNSLTGATAEVAAQLGEAGYSYRLRWTDLDDDSDGWSPRLYLEASW